MIPTITRTTFTGIAYQLRDTPCFVDVERVPIRIVAIIPDSPLPINFEYRQRGYRGLIFAERAERIEFPKE